MAVSVLTATVVISRSLVGPSRSVCTLGKGGSRCCSAHGCDNESGYDDCFKEVFHHSSFEWDASTIAYMGRDDTRRKM